MKFIKLIPLFILLLSMNSFAKTKLSNIDFKREGQIGQIIINFAEELTKTPELEVRDGFIQVSMPDVFVWPKIDKKLTINSSFDTTLTAYQFDNNNVRFRAYVPGARSLNPSKVNLKMKDKAIVVEFPVEGKEVAKAAPAVQRAPALDPASKNVSAENYDESYLNKLLADKNNLNVEVEKKNLVTATEVKTQEPAEDAVNVRQAASAKSNEFSLAGYAAKFVAFLALFIVVMYGAVHLMKKGVLGKNKLGFLNSAKAIEVLSSTYVAPKRSLMLVRAHKQVFLVGSSESGLQLISEVHDLPGLMKDGEKSLAGDNFDTNFDVVEKAEKEFNLKSVIDVPAANQEVTERVKLSDQIKSRVKGLKPLQ